MQVQDVDATPPALADLWARNKRLLIDTGSLVVKSATFNRPADTTAYTAGDLVANSTTAGSVVPLSFGTFRSSVRIRRARAQRNGIASGILRLHLFTAAPTFSAGDNAAFSSSVSGVATHICAMQSVAAGTGNSENIAMSDGFVSYLYPTQASSLPIPPVAAVILAAGASLFGLLEDRTGVTPTSGETFLISLEVEEI